jgi:PPM family protein phosphatase
VIRAFGLSDKGRVRSVNEDCFAIQEELGLCVIADGLGGHNAGEVAAHLAVDAVVNAIRCRATPSADRADTDAWPFGYDPSLSPDGNLLRTAIHLASVQILETAISANQYAGMGTTIVAVRVTDGRLSVAHAGDSRLYLVARGRLRQVTRDDSWLASILAHDPHANRDALQLHPMRNALTNVVGAMKRTTVHVVEQRLEGGEVLLLSTDGVHGVLDDDRLERMLTEDDEPRTIAQKVVSAALARGSRDNCTAVVARYR